MNNLILAGHAESNCWDQIETSINMPDKFNKQQIARGEKEKKKLNATKNKKLCRVVITHMLKALA